MNPLTSDKRKAPAKDTELENWIKAMAGGETRALESVYRATRVSVYAYAFSILKNAQDAEDALHDLYVILWSASESYQPRGKPLAWIMTITRNLCMQRLREAKKTADVPQEDWEPYLSQKESVSLEDRFLIEQCMRLLGEEEREILLLHIVSGFKHREIAGMLDLALPTVLSKYHRALKKLEKKAKENGLHDGK